MSRAVRLVIHRNQRPALPPVEIEQPMTQTEAAAWLQMSPTELSRMTAAGTVPHSRIGRSPRYLKSQLLTWLRSQDGAAA